LLNSDVIIYDLNTCNLDEAESAISALKISQYTENKTLICVSNVMTWAKSKSKEKKEGD
jgi:adenylate kinase